MNINFLKRTNPYVTIATIIVTVIIFIFQMQSTNGTYYYGYAVDSTIFVPKYIWTYGLNVDFIEGSFWQPLTSMFVHSGISHLIGNMVVLFQFGMLVENAKGRWFFAMLYYVGGITTSLLTFIYLMIFQANTNVVGASGAICVIIGYVAQKDTFNRKGLIIAVLLISFLPLLAGMPIAWHAHLIGFGVGWLIGKFIDR